MWLKKYANGGGVGNPPTHNDSVALYYNAIDKERFYRNNPNYEESSLISNTDFSSPEVRRALYDEIPRYSSEGIDSRQVERFNTSDRFLGERRFGNVPNTGLRQAGDILANELDGWFNPEAPPIYIHPHIRPQGSMGYRSTDFADFQDGSNIPHYDPLAVLNYNYLTPTQRQRRLITYGDEGFPKNYDINGDVTQPIPPNPAKQTVKQPVKKLTREQRYELYKKTPEYAEISARQQKLKDAGYNIEVDGFWGPGSQKIQDEYDNRIDKLPIKKFSPQEIPELNKWKDDKLYFRQYMNPYTKSKEVMGERESREIQKAYDRGEPMPEWELEDKEIQDYLSGRYLRWDNPKDRADMYTHYINNGVDPDGDFLKYRGPIELQNLFPSLPASNQEAKTKGWLKKY